MSGVKRQRAEDGKCEKSVGSLKEPTCQQREVHAAIGETRSLMSYVIVKPPRIEDHLQAE